MKKFYPTYLYVKTHNKTGLQYFGKTTKDPLKYLGSGKHWRRHLKIHGVDISTTVIGYYTNPEECANAAITFSKVHNIVNSNKWANMILENGLDGGATTSGPRSEDTKKKISASKKGKKLTPEHIARCKAGSVNVRKRQVGEYVCSEETKQKIREARKHQIITEETRKKISDSQKGKLRPEASIWLTGRPVSEETKHKISIANKGKLVSNETKQKLREARKHQIITEETKEKLKGKVAVIDTTGKITKITTEQFYAQSGEVKEFVFHNSAEGKLRKANAVPVISQQEILDIARMRR